VAVRGPGRSGSNNRPTSAGLGAFGRAVLELVSEIAPCSEEKLFIAAATRELRGSGNWSLLRLKQELYESVAHLTEQGLVKINEHEISLAESGTEHPARHGGVSVSSEPTMQETLGTEGDTEHPTRHGGVVASSEPAMEEVLGSIRKIISDNESGEVDAQTATPSAQAENKSLEDGVDKLIVDDSARALTSDEAEMPASHEQEILELTEELGGLGVIEDEDAEVLDAALEDIDHEGAEVLDVLEPLELDHVIAETPINPDAEQAQQQSLGQEQAGLAASARSPSQWASARLERVRLRAGKTARSSTPSAELKRSRIAPNSVNQNPGPDSEPAAQPTAVAAIAAHQVENEMPPLDLSLPELSAEPEALDLSASMEEVALAVKDAVVALKASQDSWAPNSAARPMPTSAGPEPPAFVWSDREPDQQSSLEPGQLVENFPRRMRANIPVEAEVRVAVVSNLPNDVLIGSGQPQPGRVAQAITLKLSAPEGGFIIESQSPETQWLPKESGEHNNRYHACWRFTLTPTKRGLNTLTLAFSYKEAGAHGIVADITLPDKVLKIVVATNLGKVFKGAAIGLLIFLLGAALGAYLHPLMKLAGLTG
jgi:hypothetical protein